MAHVRGSWRQAANNPHTHPRVLGVSPFPHTGPCQPHTPMAHKPRPGWTTHTQTNAAPSCRQHVETPVFKSPAGHENTRWPLSSTVLGLTEKGAAMFKLHTGDCIDVLRTLPSGSVDSVVTSPPYAMQRKSTYGGIPEKDYPAWTVEWMAALWDALADDGSVIINISPHIKNGELSDYVLRTRLALREAGWVELPELIWHKTVVMPTGAPNRPRRSWESLLWFAKHGRAFGNPKANGHPVKEWKDHDTSQAADNGWSHTMAGSFKRPDVARCTDIYSSRINQVKTGHPATFPVGLAEWCGKLITPPGGTILDPFTGSSSTGVAAIRNGWHFIGIDQSPEYIEMSNRRLSAELANTIPKEGDGNGAHTRRTSRP